jgi:hypothetical protein
VHQIVYPMPESGGTVELPDGTIIEVTPQ